MQDVSYVFIKTITIFIQTDGKKICFIKANLGDLLLYRYQHCLYGAVYKQKTSLYITYRVKQLTLLGKKYKRMENFCKIGLVPDLQSTFMSSCMN